MGIFSGIGNQLGQLNSDLNNQVEEIKKDKILTMDKVFNELKEKINKYNELSKDTERLGVNNSEVAKVEEEIKSLKAKIDELNSSIEGKSKIEKMKITLNITSIESEITLKEMDLEEEKKKAEKDYDSRIQSSNKKIEDTKKELEIFIKDTEETLEKTVKNLSKKEEINNFKLTTLQEQGLNKLGLSVSDLLGLTLSNSELLALAELSRYTKMDIENLSIPSSLKNNTNNPIKLKLKRLLNRKNSKILKLKLIEGTDLEETKNYYDNIMKVELSNLENIEKEESELNKKTKLTSQTRGTNCSNEEIKNYTVEVEKLKIKKEAVQNKINTVNEMVDEMIKEVVKEELKKREIVIPAFVPVTKYFNVPSEE